MICGSMYVGDIVYRNAFLTTDDRHGLGDLLRNAQALLSDVRHGILVSESYADVTGTYSPGRLAD